MQGWIKIHRQLAENPLWLIKPFSEGQAWVDLILITTYDEGFIKIKNGEVLKLKRGECGYSQLTLSERWGWSRGKVKRFLNLLESEKMIQQKIVGNFTIINILNYDKFQNDTTNSTTNDTTDGQQTIQQTDTIKNVNKEKNEKNIYLAQEEKKKTDPFYHPAILEYEKQFKNIVGKRCYLDAKHRNKIIELNADIDNFIETLPTVLKRLKFIKFDKIGFIPNSSWLLKDDNYIKVLEGTFGTKEKEEEYIYNAYN